MTDDITSLLIRNANIPRRYREPVPFDPRKHAGWTAAFDRALHILKSSVSGNLVIVCGARGTGKTLLSTELIYCLIRNDRFLCRYDNLLDYLNRIRDRDSLQDHDETYLTPRLLVLDEIAKGGDSAWAESRLFHLVNSRYNDLKHTLLITSAGPDQLNDILSPSVADRVHEGGAVIHLDWPSFRSNP